MKKSKQDSGAKKSLEDVGRRNLLKGVGLAGAAALSSVATRSAMAADKEITASATIPLREALENLTSAEAACLEIICDCLIPSDENGPGALEARAVHYIDRSLATHNKQFRQNYLESLSALNEYSLKTRGKEYPQLSRDVQQSILIAMQDNKLTGFSPSCAGFFNLLRNHTIEGTFGDPYYGGNKNFVGWDMLKYPGIRLSVSTAEVAAGSALEPTHQSAYDHQTYTKMADNISLAQGSDEFNRGKNNA